MIYQYITLFYVIVIMAIFHEIGHFQVCDRMKKDMTKKNMGQIELQCDRYGLFALVRMLYYQPHYRTISILKRQIDFENNLRKLMGQTIQHKGLKVTELRHKFAGISDRVMELMDWEDIYEQ